MYKILSIFIILALYGCNVGSNKHMVTLPSHGKVKNMKRDDSRAPILLFPDKAEPCLLTDMEIPGNPMITDIEYLALQDNIGYLSFEIKKVLFKNDRIIIFDNSWNSAAVFIFDTLGVGIKKLSSGGRGSTEFLGIGDIYFILGTDYFVIADLLTPRVQTFDLDGNHIRHEYGVFHAVSHHPINDSIIFHGSGYQQNYHIEDLIDYSIYCGICDSILYRGFPYLPHQKCDWATSKFFVNYKGDFQIKQHAVDSIYQIINDSTYFVPYVV